jgi:hypothetical protein
MSTFVSDSWRRVLLAAAVSGALHLGVIALAVRHVPAPPEDLPPLQVQVVRLAPTAGPPPSRPARSAHSSRSGPPIQKTVPIASSASRADTELTANATAEELGTGEEAAPAEAAASPPPMEEPVTVATAPPTALSPEPPPVPDFPPSGQIRYDLLYGSQRFPVGRTVQSWKIDGTRYQLASRSETTGIVDLFRSQHRTYLSRGELTPDGLRPEIFLMSRDRGGGRGIEEGRAQFHWTRGTVTLGNATSLHEESLPAGSQDLVSFVYQLAIDPPPTGRRQVSITNGTRLHTYVVEVLPEETIETPLGVLRTLPVRQLRKAGAESVDVWLAVEHRHLPVRMRFYSRDGEPAGEQMVTEIQLATE